MWSNTGTKRPDFAIEPAPGQESVWDYPRPPAVVAGKQAIEIRHGDKCLATSDTSWWIKETASPPSVYIPFSCVDRDEFVETSGQSFCEWKGAARYWALADDPSVPVAWSYPDPSQRFREITDHLSFYPDRVECFVDSERVRAQAGGFYGGWIIDRIVGPFKGEPGTLGW